MQDNNAPPPPMPMDPPCQWTRHANAPPPVSKEETWPPCLPPLKGRNIPPPPPRFFHQIAQNCPFLPSFLSVQWHVMGTILGVMCLIFISQNVPSLLWSRLRLSGRSCLHFVKPSTWPCWPEPICTIAYFRGTKVSGLRKGLHPARLFLLISSGVHCATQLPLLCCSI